MPQRQAALGRAECIEAHRIAAALDRYDFRLSIAILKYIVLYRIIAVGERKTRQAETNCLFAVSYPWAYIMEIVVFDNIVLRNLT
ncbi:hypothetical protein D3C78_1390740 [compost metagenome]